MAVLNLKQLLKDMPVSFSRERRGFTFENVEYDYAVTSTADALEMFRYFRRMDSEIRHLSPSHLKGGVDQANFKILKDSLYSSRTDWVGGTADDLLYGKADMKVFREESKKFQSSDLYKKIVRKIGETTKRTRQRCEYDGEWDHDARWEVKPFNRSIRMKSISGQIVTITADFCFSSNVNTEEINRYGAFVASIVKALESCGINTELYIRHTGKEFLSNPEKRPKSMMVGVYKVKDSSEYMPTSLLLKVFSSNFLRRMMHAQIPCSAMFINEEVVDNLGVPISFGSVWSMAKDAISIHSVPNMEDQKKISEKLLDFITKKEDESETKTKEAANG